MIKYLKCVFTCLKYLLHIIVTFDIYCRIQMRSLVFASYNCHIFFFTVVSLLEAWCHNVTLKSNITFNHFNVNIKSFPDSMSISCCFCCYCFFFQVLYFVPIFNTTDKEGMIFWNQYGFILVDVSLSKVITLEPVINWWSWMIRLVAFSQFFFYDKFPSFRNRVY